MAPPWFLTFLCLIFDFLAVRQTVALLKRDGVIHFAAKLLQHVLPLAFREAYVDPIKVLGDRIVPGYAVGEVGCISEPALKLATLLSVKLEQGLVILK